MPQSATAQADRDKSARAPEYSPSAGAKTSTDAHPVTETANEARQAVTGHGVNVVLVVSLAAVIVAFVAIYVAFFT